MKHLIIIGAALLNVIAAIGAWIGGLYIIFQHRDSFLLLMLYFLLLAVYGILTGIPHHICVKKYGVSSMCFLLSTSLPVVGTAALYTVYCILEINNASGMFAGLQAAGAVLAMITAIGAAGIFLLVTLIAQCALVGYLKIRTGRSADRPSEKPIHNDRIQ